MQKRILFRVDAGGPVGLGHFYRSCSLARVLSSKGHRITFVHLDSSFWKGQENFEFEDYVLDSNDPSEKMVEIARKGSFDILFVDGIIDFKKDIFKSLAETTKIIFYQNLSESKALSNIFILPSIHQSDSFFESFKSSGTKIFKGLDFFTFNDSIASINKKNVIFDKVSNIAITAGGSDPANVLLQVHRLIDYKRWSDISFKFYYGKDYLHKKSVPRELSDKIEFLPYNQELISDSDLLIASFGVSTYEFMGLGLPIISLGHQKSNADASRILAERTQSILHLGVIDQVDTYSLNTAIGTMVESKSIRKNFSARGQKLIDFNGLERVAEIIEKA